LLYGHSRGVKGKKRPVLKAPKGGKKEREGGKHGTREVEGKD